MYLYHLHVVDFTVRERVAPPSTSVIRLFYSKSLAALKLTRRNFGLVIDANTKSNLRFS